jgi:hypothetical protein
MTPLRLDQAKRGEQADLFDMPPCSACGQIHEPHFLPNYEPPVWVIGKPPKCGNNVYGPTRESLIAGAL